MMNEVDRYFFYNGESLRSNQSGFLPAPSLVPAQTYGRPGKQIMGGIAYSNNASWALTSLHHQ